MSETFTVTKEIEIDVEDSKVTTTKQIELQIDYVECSKCGNEMDFRVDTDNYGDMQISAEPCQCIIKE